MNAMNVRSASVTLKLYQKFFDLVRLGTKTIEGRVDEPAKFKDLKVGNYITFVQTEDPRIHFSAKVCGIRRYPSFSEMLKNEKLEKCLPGFKDIAEGVKLYHSIPNFEQDAKKYGVISMELEVQDGDGNADFKKA